MIFERTMIYSLFLICPIFYLLEDGLKAYNGRFSMVLRPTSVRFPRLKLRSRRFSGLLVDG